MPDIPRFHLAFPVRDLVQTRYFYGQVIGCAEGRSTDHWIDFNFYGHQLVAHLAKGEVSEEVSEVDGHDVPLRHFGVLLKQVEFDSVVDRLRAAGARFIIEPRVRFQGMPGEQATCFFLDPFGNALEMKAFADDAMVFAR